MRMNTGSGAALYLMATGRVCILQITASPKAQRKCKQAAGQFGTPSTARPYQTDGGFTALAAKTNA